MNLALALGIIFMVAVARRGTLPISALLGAMWLIALWVMTFGSHLANDFEQVDEIFFAETQASSIFANRSLWLMLNSITALTTDEVVNHMRVLNLVFLLILYGIAVRVFRTFRPLTLALMLSYFACVAALNLRDTLLFIPLLILLDRYDLGQTRNQGALKMARAMGLPALLMFLLRPMQLGILYIATIRWHYAIPLFLVFITVLQTPIGERYLYNLSWHVSNFEQSVTDRGEDKVADARPTLRNITEWSARFIFAPLPWTSLQRIFVDQTYEYGQVDLTVRAGHRLILYGLALYLFYHLLKRPRWTLGVLLRYSYVIKFILIFSVVYAIFNFGGSHERVKMNVFIALLFLVDRLRRTRRTSLKQWWGPHEN